MLHELTKEEARLAKIVNGWIDNEETSASIIWALFERDNWDTIKKYLGQLETADSAYYRVDIPNFRPMTLNEFRGAGEYGRHIEQSGKQEMIGLLLKCAEDVPRVTESNRPVRRIRLTVRYGKGLRRHDKDAFDKVAKDAIKRAGLIVDDSLHWLEWEIELTLDKKLPDKTHETTLEIWDLRQGAPAKVKKPRIITTKAAKLTKNPQEGLQVV